MNSIKKINLQNFLNYITSNKLSKYRDKKIPKTTAIPTINTVSYLL